MLQAIRELKFNFRYNSEYLPIIALSFISFTFIYRFLSPFLSKKLCKNYSKLSYNHKVEWNVRLTSTVFSIIVSTLCIYILVVDHGLSSSPLMYELFFGLLIF
jgi:hypothetical protein